MYDVSLIQVKTREVTMKSYEMVLKMLMAELVCKQHSHCQQSLGLCKHTSRGRQTFLLANIVAETTKYAKLRPANIHLARCEQINDIENNGDMVELAKRGGCNISGEGKGNKQGSALSDWQLAYLYQLSQTNIRRILDRLWYYLCQPVEIFLREEVDP